MSFSENQSISIQQVSIRSSVAKPCLFVLNPSRLSALCIHIYKTTLYLYLLNISTYKRQSVLLIVRLLTILYWEPDASRSGLGGLLKHLSWDR